MDQKKHVGARIREIRRRRKLSQETVAERLHISPQYVSNIERGRANPGLSLLIRLASTLEVSLGELCDLELEVAGQSAQEIRSAITTLVKSEKDPERLRTALRVLKAALR